MKKYKCGNATIHRLLLLVMSPQDHSAITHCGRPRGLVGLTNAEIAARIAACRPPDCIIWMCSSCGETYDGDCPPIQCYKCNRGGFERNVIPQRMLTERLTAAS